MIFHVFSNCFYCWTRACICLLNGNFLINCVSISWLSTSYFLISSYFVMFCIPFCSLNLWKKFIHSSFWKIVSLISKCLTFPVYVFISFQNVVFTISVAFSSFHLFSKWCLVVCFFHVDSLRRHKALFFIAEETMKKVKLNETKKKASLMWPYGR